MKIRRLEKRANPSLKRRTLNSFKPMNYRIWPMKVVSLFSQTGVGTNKTVPERQLGEGKSSACSVDGCALPSPPSGTESST